MRLRDTPLLILAILAATAGLLVGREARGPLLAAYRPWVLVTAVALAALPLVWLATRRAASYVTAAPRLATMLVAALGLAGITTAIATESRYQLARTRVLATSPARLAPLGRHIIVGYSDSAEIKRLVELGAVGGLFVTQRNVAGRTQAEIADEIAVLQTTARELGRPPLVIATDQEGGRVSRLSPPLPRLPLIRDVLARQTGAPPGTDLVADHAREQGQGLAALGVTLNFSPVVDLDFDIRHPGDRHSRISERAISRDPNVVARAARSYCRRLMAAGVACTLKHFPGLGRVRGDSHRGEVRLTASADELRGEDWWPFQTLWNTPGVVVMVGHARLTAIDPERPASLSAKVIAGLMRTRLGFDGVIVTDDLCMGAITSRPEGIGQAAVASLIAGADLLLLSWDGDQVYAALDALLDAESDGRLDPAIRERSARRLAASPLWRPQARFTQPTPEAPIPQKALPHR